MKKQHKWSTTMSLTIKEKEHWKDRIAQKIEQKINRLVSSTQRNYLKNVAELARSKAIESVGLVENERQQAELERTVEQSNAELERLKIAFGAAITGLSVEAIVAKGIWRTKELIDSEFRTLTIQQERLIMQGDELGREILKLRDEQEQLLDTVWLATSTMQIRQLWQGVHELLADQPTALQTTAINIESNDG
jgi:hypothetical protein